MASKMAPRLPEGPEEDFKRAPREVSNAPLNCPSTIPRRLHEAFGELPRRKIRRGSSGKILLSSSLPVSPNYPLLIHALLHIILPILLILLPPEGQPESRTSTRSVKSQILLVVVLIFLLRFILILILILPPPPSNPVSPPPSSYSLNLSARLYMSQSGTHAAALP